MEDLYRPYKQKRRTKATIAKERGLEPLAEELLKYTKQTMEQLATPLFKRRTRCVLRLKKHWRAHAIF